jgi:hypothetical protein
VFATVMTFVSLTDMAERLGCASPLFQLAVVFAMRPPLLDRCAGRI